MTRKCALSVALVAAAVCMADSTQEPWKAPARAARKKNPIAVTEQSLAAGKVVYIKECLSCHGETGKGDGPSAKDLEVPAGNLSNSMVWKQSDGELFWKITEGRKPMPTFADLLTDDQRWNVVNYVRTLAPRPGPSSAPRLPEPQAGLFRAVVLSYLTIQDALVKQRGDVALEAAKGFLDAATKLGGSTPPALEGTTTERWAALTGAIATSAGRTAGAADLDAMRAEFSAVSDALVACLKDFEAPMPLKQFRCPRALDGSGACWLQEGSTSANPYIAMTGCPCCESCGEFGTE